jgi:hypothetical protein
MLSALDDGLKNLGRGGSFEGLGDGELRRRKDLIINTRKEKDGLDDLLQAMATKSRLDHAVASVKDKDTLLRAQQNGNDAGGRRTPRSGRVLGKETERTRELDNEGVLLLQAQTMQDQDTSVEQLMKIVARQKELGIAIHEELEVQNEMLRMADEDAERYVHHLVLVFLLILTAVLDCKPSSMLARSGSRRSLDESVLFSATCDDGTLCFIWALFFSGVIFVYLAFNIFPCGFSDFYLSLHLLSIDRACYFISTFLNGGIILFEPGRNS